MANRRSFGQLRRLPSRRWQAFYTGPDTALHYAPSTFDAKIDAEAWLADERRLIASGAWVAPDERHHAQVTSITLGRYAAPWLADRTLKPRTREHYQSLLDRQILPSLGDKPLRALTPVIDPGLARRAGTQDTDAAGARVRPAADHSRHGRA